jgi:hypothetical protein
MKHSANPFARGYYDFETERVEAGQTVLCRIYGKTRDGSRTHVTNIVTEDAAQAAIRNLRFQTGIYSRCWEISSAHITAKAHQYLCDLADKKTSPEFLFIPFRIPYFSAIGVKLIATPWTDQNVERIGGITAKQLRREHRSKGVPKCLIQVLELAADADVRILIFDGDAPILEGLPVYETWS